MLAPLIRQQSLCTRLVFTFMLVVLIPFVGTNLYCNWIISQVLQNQAVASALASLKLCRQQMESFLRRVVENLIFLS